MFINNINGVINKNLSLLFSVRHEISMEDKTKTPKIDQKSSFFISLFFFLKIQDIRKPKTQIFEKGSHKNVLDQVLTIFRTSP